MREEKEEDTNDSDSDADMLAQLPDHILDNILFFLPTADAAVMATVSKYWLNLWNSFITVHFSFNETTQTLQSFLPIFLPCVKDSLNFLGSPDENPTIHSFVLNMHFSKQRRQFHDMHNMLYISKISTCLDDWISLLLQNDVKHLKIRFSNMIYYVPPDIFWGTGFLTVHVEGCYITGDPIFRAGDSSFNGLTELVLVNVQTSTSMVHKILSDSPLLEKIVLRNLSKMDSLVICNLPRLCYVEVEQALEDKIEIRAPNLSTLILKLYGSIEGFFSDSFTGGGNFGSEKIVFEHAMLETLKLCFTSCARVKVACSNLRTMSLSNKGYEIPLHVEVDAPNIEQLDYDGYVIPSFHGVTSLLKPIVTLNLMLGGQPGLDVAARSCIEMFNQPTVHLVYIYRGFFKAQEILWPGQVQQMEVTSPPPKVKCLTWFIKFSTPSFAYQLLLDGSLCTCHPSVLRVKALPSNWEFMEFLCHTLLNREENPSCCKDEPKFRCWRHYLKSVDVQIQSQSETEKPETIRSKDLKKTLNRTSTSEEIQFNMNWSRDLV